MSGSFSRPWHSEEALHLLDPSLSETKTLNLDNPVASDVVSDVPQHLTGEKSPTEDALVKKIDSRMSIIILIYILNCIDRNSAAAARLRGFEEDLQLEGSQFASIISIFYFGYTLMQVPSNMFLNSIGRPSVFLPSCIIAWGTVSFCTGFVTDFYGALLARFLLGFVEAAFFPGTLYLLSRWYKRNELSFRMAVLFCGNLISNAFGSIIASGILDAMDGVRGYSAWRWLFFIEGSLTILVAVAAFFILPDFPERKAPWLTPSEHALAQKRLRGETTEINIVRSRYANPSFDEDLGTFAGLRLAFTDPKVWRLAAILFFMDAAMSFNMYFPTLSATMGYNTTISLLLCSPPWMVGALASLWVSRHSDKVGERCTHAAIPLCISILGFLLAMSTMNVAVRYISLFLMTISYAGFNCFFAWAASSVFLYTPKPTRSVPHPVPLLSPAKGAVALALLNASSLFPNIIAAYFWPKAWGPTYNKSYLFCAVSMGIAVWMCLGFRTRLRRLNGELDTLECQLLEIGDVELESRGKGWRYML